MADLNINNGIGVVWGISTAKKSTGTGYLMPVEQDYQKTRQSEPHGNSADGSVIGETYYRKECTIRMRVYPAGNGNSDAISANQSEPEPGSEFVLVDTDDPDLTGEWSVVDVSKQHRWADKVYWDLNLRRWGNNFVTGNGGQRISAQVPGQVAPS